MKKWLLRLLVLFAVLTGLILFSLKIVSGTSDSHKRGLEQAFSEIFKGEAKFTALKQFNLIPQFTIEIEGLQIIGANSNGNLTADNMLIAFGPIDLMAKSRLIEKFNVKNLRLTEGLYTPLALSLTDIGIYPNEAGDAGKLSFKGTYGVQDMEGEFAMAVKSGARPKYFFNEQNAFALHLGQVQVTGLFLPYATGGAKVSHIELTADSGKQKLECAALENKTFEFSALIDDIFSKIAKVKSPQDFNKLCGSF